MGRGAMEPAVVNGFVEENMSDLLTREQVDKTLQAMIGDKVDGVLAANLFAHDAALRTRIAEVEQQVQWDIQDSCELEREMENLGMVCYDDYGALHPVEVVRAFIAAKDAEIARLKHEISQLLFFTPGEGK